MYSVHDTAEVEDNVSIGSGTKIWHHAQIRGGAVIGRNCNIGKNVYVDANVKIGDNVKIQNNVSLYDGVTVEDDVFIGPGTCFTNDPYPRAAIWDSERKTESLVKRGASLGANSTIICGVTVGMYALIGAGSVVTKDVPDHALAYGNPARVRAAVCKCGLKLEKGVKRCQGCSEETIVPENLWEDDR